MAERAHTLQSGFMDYLVHAWAGLQNGDQGATTSSVRSGDRVIQVSGTFGVGGSLIIEGSLDGDTWFQLRDPTGSLLSFTAAGGKAVMESTPYIRPRISAGDSDTNLSCMISVRRNR